MSIESLLTGIIAFLILFILWLINRKPDYPIDNKRRSLLRGEKIAVVEKTVKKFGKAKCWHCGATEDLDYDHITPLEKGGTNSPDNLQLLCSHCNKSKGDRYIG